MKQSKYFAPYYISGKGKDRKYKCSLKNNKKSGVYFIVKDKKVIYVGQSQTDIYRTMYRHFQEWNDKKQHRHNYSKEGYLIRVIFCTPKQALRLEEYFILKFYPGDNKFKFENYTEAKENKILEQKIDLGDLSPVEYLDEPF